MYAKKKYGEKKSTGKKVREKKKYVKKKSTQKKSTRKNKYAKKVREKKYAKKKYGEKNPGNPLAACAHPLRADFRQPWYLYYCTTTTIVRKNDVTEEKKCGEKMTSQKEKNAGENDVTSGRAPSGQGRSLPVAPPQMITELSPYTTMNLLKKYRFLCELSFFIYVIELY